MIINTLGLVAFWWVIILAGRMASLLLAAGERRRWPEEIALALSLGCGVVAVLLFWISLTGFKPNYLVLAAILLGAFAVRQIHRWRSGERRPLATEDAEPPSTLNRVLTCLALLAIAGCVILVALNTLGLPIYEWDSFSIWALKAKVVAFNPLTPRPDYFQDRALSYSHLDYPLLVPFLMAGIYGMVGEINDQLGKSVFLVLYVAFALQLFTALRWKLRKTEALVLTAVGVSVPVLVRWGGAGVADPALMLYYIGALFYALRWREQARTSDLLLSIVYGGFAAFTKNEGLPLALLIGAAMVLFALIERSRAGFLGGIAFLGGVLLINTPWLWWSSSIPRTHEDYLGHLRISTIIENSNRLGVILHEFLAQAWTWSRWGGLWVLFAVALVFGWRGLANRRIILLWLVLVGQLSLYVMALMVGPWDVRELLDSALDRLLLQTVPVVVLLIAFHWSEGGQSRHNNPVT